MDNDLDDGAFSRITVGIRVKTSQWLEILPDVRNVCSTAARTAVTVGRMGKVLLSQDTGIELAIVLANDAIMRVLNRNYRGQDKSTNVLSFAALDIPSESFIFGEPLDLGDVVIALQTTLYEAKYKAVPIANHLQHLVVHGTLHLLGYDHQKNDAAKAMENLEAQILACLGVADPYVEINVP